MNVANPTYVERRSNPIAGLLVLCIFFAIFCMICYCNHKNGGEWDRHSSYHSETVIETTTVVEHHDNGVQMQAYPPPPGFAPLAPGM